MRTGGSSDKRWILGGAGRGGRNRSEGSQDEPERAAGTRWEKHLSKGGRSRGLSEQHESTRADLEQALVKEADYEETIGGLLTISGSDVAFETDSCGGWTRI